MSVFVREIGQCLQGDVQVDAGEDLSFVDHPKLKRSGLILVVWKRFVPIVKELLVARQSDGSM